MINKNLLLKEYSREQVDQIFRYLIEHVTKKNYSLYLTNPELTNSQINEINELIDIHINQNKPLQYILGFVDFIDCKLIVEPPILIPRPETEEWVYALTQEISNFKNETLNIVDVGTGTGCIAISLAKFLKNSKIFALDINDKALILAQKNANFNEVKNIEFIKSNVFSNFDKKVDIIVSNPPYISTADYNHLDLAVKNWEDKDALTTADGGLRVIKKIIRDSKKYLKRNFDVPKIILEIDSKQGNLVAGLMKDHGFKPKVLNDYSGKNRVCIAY